MPQPEQDAPALEQLLDAMLPQVVFDGWSPGALSAAAGSLGLGHDEVRALAPRGAIDLAAALHRRSDRRVAAAIAAGDFSGLPAHDRLAHAIRLWLDGQDREVIRRSAALFALPYHAAEGARLIWGTADTIWTALGDASVDLDWYTKRMTLSSIFSATVLYWLGDTSAGAGDTWAFLGRRLDRALRFEALRGRVRALPGMRELAASPFNPLSHVRAPRARASGCGCHDPHTGEAR